MGEVQEQKKAELYPLWIMMKVVVDKRINKLQVLGTQIFWWKANIESQLTNMALERILTKKIGGNNVIWRCVVSHIYSEFNSKANKLSKETLLLHEWTLVEHELRGSVPFDESHRSMF